LFEAIIAAAAIPKKKICCKESPRINGAVYLRNVKII
jgi:hypothetical protein